MNRREPVLSCRLAAFAFFVLLTGFAPTARGDYAANVLSQGPVGYWRFNETNQPPPQPILATNVGSLGESVNGDLLNGVIRGGPGLLSGTGITADRFTNSTWLVRTAGSYVNVPYTNALNPNGPFTVEFWAKPSSAPPLDPPDAPESVFSTVCSLDTQWGPNCRMGYVFYIDGASGGWQFRIGNFNGYLAIAKGGTFTPGGWTHVAGVCSGSGLALYVDGQPVATTNYDGSAFMPNTNTHFRVGMTTLFPGGNRPFDGWIEEVAFYATNLDGDTIKAHYDAGTTNASGYAGQLLAANPLGYWRLDEPADPAATNLGSLSHAADGSYIADVAPGVPSARPPDFPGFDSGNNSVAFDGGGGYVQVPPLNLNANNVTISGWVRPSGPQAPLAGLFMNRGSSSAGLAFDAGGGLGLTYNWNNDPATYNWVSGLVLPDSDWAYVALVVQPTQAALYLGNGTNSFTGATNVLAHTAQPFDGFNIFGGDPITNTRFFIGDLDEFAIFTRSLSVGELFSQYAAAVDGVPPQIFVGPQPPTNQLFTGDAFTLSVDAGGTPLLAYQWRKDGTDIPEATSNVFTKAGIDSPDTGAYAVVVSNSFGFAVSQPVTIEVTALAVPAITQGPLGRTLYPGGTLNLAVTATGGTLDYQWQKDDQPIAGATAATYSVANVSTNDSGTYIVTVSNRLGLAMSTGAVVTVVSPLPGSFEAAIVSDQPEAWWRLDESLGTTVMIDSMGRHDGTYNNNVLLGSPGAIAGSPGTAASFDGTSYGSVPFSAALNSPSFTMECWVKTTNMVDMLCPASTHYLNKGCYFLSGVPAPGQWTAAYGSAGADNLVISSTAAATMASNAWTHLVVTVDSGTFLRFYINGQWDQTAYFDLEHNSGGPLLIGARGVSSSVAADLFWKGQVDEVAVYTNRLSLAQIQAHYAAALYSTNTAPIFKLQPQSQVSELGTSLTLQARVEGTLPISFQWLKDNIPIFNETNTTLMLSNLTFASAGGYEVIATNQVGGTSSDSAVVAVMPPPAFANLTNGLVLHLAFDEDFRDSSGLGHDATANGSPIFITGQIGSNAIQVSTLQISSAYNYVSVPLTPDLAFSATDSFSISFWVNYTNAPDDLPMLGNAVHATLNQGWVFADRGGQLQWTMIGTDDTSVIATPVGGPTLNNGAWHHVAAAMDRAVGLANTYIDGQLIDTRSIAGVGAVDTGKSITLGQDPTGLYAVAGMFNIDDVGIWRRALSIYDVQSIYQLGVNSQSFDTYGPVTLLQVPIPGGFQLIWQAGTLLQADAIDGIWTPVLNAAPPIYTVTPGPDNKFFRVQL